MEKGTHGCFQAATLAVTLLLCTETSSCDGVMVQDQARNCILWPSFSSPSPEPFPQRFFTNSQALKYARKAAEVAEQAPHNLCIHVSNGGEAGRAPLSCRWIRTQTQTEVGAGARQEIAFGFG